MKLIPINVECYAGYKADEYPKCFSRGDVRYEISEITDCWYQEDKDPMVPAADYFKVKTMDSHQYILRHEIHRDIWYLVITQGN